MQRYLGVKILDLAAVSPNLSMNFFRGLVVCLLQTDQGGRGHTVRLVICVLCAEVFDKGVEAVYRPRWVVTVPGQCCPLELGRHDIKSRCH